jgi:hypothetical protein
MPLENSIQPATGGFRRSCGRGVFVNQPAQDGSSADPCGVEVGHGSAASVAMAIGYMLRDARV